MVVLYGTGEPLTLKYFRFVLVVLWGGLGIRHGIVAIISRLLDFIPRSSNSSSGAAYGEGVAVLWPFLE